MKSLLFMILVTISLRSDYDLITIRTAYADAAKNRAGLKRLQQILEPLNISAVPVLICYRGAAEMMAAKYAVNPLNKLNAFSKGKQLIESAISSGSANIECHFIRYGIQRNLPSVLNYHDQIRADSIKIMKGLDTLSDKDLKQRIKNYINNN